MECSSEELVVALADHLWKGNRNVELQHLVIDRVAGMLQQDYWELFVVLDSGFELIAAEGHIRLNRSTLA